MTANSPYIARMNLSEPLHVQGKSSALVEPAKHATAEMPMLATQLCRGLHSFGWELNTTKATAVAIHVISTSHVQDLWFRPDPV